MHYVSLSLKIDNPTCKTAPAYSTVVYRQFYHFVWHCTKSASFRIELEKERFSDRTFAMAILYISLLGVHKCQSSTATSAPGSITAVGLAPSFNQGRRLWHQRNCLVVISIQNIFVYMREDFAFSTFRLPNLSGNLSRFITTRTKSCSASRAS